jgi:hypothetical protein
LGSAGLSAGAFSLSASRDVVRSNGDEGSGESRRLSSVGGGGGGGGRFGMGNSLCAIYTSVSYPKRQLSSRMPSKHMRTWSNRAMISAWSVGHVPLYNV